jgi:hypothetical protein
VTHCRIDEHRIELDAFASALDHRPPDDGVGGGVEHHALRFESIAPGAPALLLVVLDRFRHAGVEHESDVGAIDAHSKGDGGHDQIALLRRELFLCSAPLLR